MRRFCLIPMISKVNELNSFINPQTGKGSWLNTSALATKEVDS
ncbi:hypothetical protein [Gelidibacter sp. F63206]|nr:hypothetical protein [Gelidibacter sp. F63206]